MLYDQLIFYIGTIHEPMTDLVHLMSKLVKPNGEILVPGIMDMVAPVTDAELEIYRNISFNLKDIHDAAGSKTTIFNTEKEVLMARWV